MGFVRDGFATDDNLFKLEINLCQKLKKEVAESEKKYKKDAHKRSNRKNCSQELC